MKTEAVGQRGEPRLGLFRRSGELLCPDGGEGAVDAAGDFAVGHGTNQCHLFSCPPAERAEPIEAAAKALGHSASEFLWLGKALNTP